MYTFLHEPKLIENIYREYLHHVNYYQNIVRPSFFIKYFNLNINESISEDELHSTYDIYSASSKFSKGIKFDTYDVTPVYHIDAINNRSQFVQDLDGQRLEGQTTIITYTISRPKIHDLVVFYDPIQSDEIFRVVNVNTPANMLHSDPSSTWFELELDYAPLKSVEDLPLNEKYVYDLSTEQNLTVSEYKSYINKLERALSIFNEIKSWYNTYHDVYESDRCIHLALNECIYLLKKRYNQKYKRILENIRAPYGLLDKLGSLYYEQDLNKMPYNLHQNSQEITFHYYDMDSKEIREFTWNPIEQPINNSLDKACYLGFELYKELVDGI